MCNVTNGVLNVAIQSLPKVSPSIIDILSGVLAPLIALIAVYIAWQQYYINKQRLRHETYESRVKIYKIVQKFLSNITATGYTDYGKCHVFYSEASEAIFLFESSVMQYIDDLYDKGIELSERKEELFPSDGSQGIQGTERMVVSRRRGELFKWFAKQLSESQALFKEHIRITT